MPGKERYTISDERSLAVGSRAAAASHISLGSKVSAANIVRMTTAQKASAPIPGSIVITEPNATKAPSSDSMKMSIIDQRPIKRTM